MELAFLILAIGIVAYLFKDLVYFVLIYILMFLAWILIGLLTIIGWIIGRLSAIKHYIKRKFK